MSRSAVIRLTPTPSPPSRLADLAAIAASFAHSFAPGLPRYLQVKNAIIRLIQAGELRAGTQLPPDQQLTGALHVSLGTVQKAFGGLAADGWISREHGRGTFIAQSREPVTELWHYRFRDSRSEAFLPVYSRLLKRRLVGADQRLVRALGDDPKGYVEIERLVDIGGEFNCYSQLYLRADRFARILEKPSAAIESVNLKKLFADEFGAPTVSVEQSVRSHLLAPEIAKLIGVAKGVCGMVLEAVAFTHGRAPFSFQCIHIPPSDYALDVSPFMSAPKTSRG
jgi:DNA-binding GntR family transcriptional regulator